MSCSVLLLVLQALFAYLCAVSSTASSFEGARGVEKPTNFSVTCDNNEMNSSHDLSYVEDLYGKYEKLLDSKNLTAQRLRKKAGLMCIVKNLRANATLSQRILKQGFSEPEARRYMRGIYRREASAARIRETLGFLRTLFDNVLNYTTPAEAELAAVVKTCKSCSTNRSAFQALLVMMRLQFCLKPGSNESDDRDYVGFYLHGRQLNLSNLNDLVLFQL